MTSPSSDPQPAVSRARKAVAFLALGAALAITVVVPGMLVLLHEPHALAQGAAGTLPRDLLDALTKRLAAPPAPPPEDLATKAKDLLSLVTPFVLIAGMWGMYVADQKTTKAMVTKNEEAVRLLGDKIEGALKAAEEKRSELRATMEQHHLEMRDRTEKIGRDVTFIQRETGAKRPDSSPDHRW